MTRKASAMARIQILELPTVYAEDSSETPFAVIIDQADETITKASVDWRGFADGFGARTAVVFEGTVDIPANDYSGQSINTVDGGTVSVKVVPDLSDFAPAVEAAVADANLRLFAARHHAHVQRYTPGQTDADIDAGRRRHRPVDRLGEKICAECSVRYPCAIVKALDGGGSSG